MARMPIANVSEVAAPTPVVADESQAQVSADLPPLNHRERRPVALALLLSVAIHTLLLSLVLGGEGRGLPGFALPGRGRRTEAPDLHIVLVPARVKAAEPVIKAAPEPPRRTPIEPPVAVAAAPAPPRPAVQLPKAAAIDVAPPVQPAAIAPA